MDSEERWIELETKVAYQDHAMGVLEGVLLEMRGEIDRLQRELKDVRNRVESGNPEFGPADDKPPHW
jgi:uncharacterized coiled-coil protein SlyX